MGGGGSKDENWCLETITDHEQAINCIAVSEDGSLIITGSEDSTAIMWSTNMDDTEALGVLKGHNNYITCITICDTFIITGSADCTLRKWDMTTCECLFVYEGHESRISRVICSGDYIFSTSYDRTAKAWQFGAEYLSEGEEDQACIRTFKGHSKGVYPIIYIPDTYDALDDGSIPANDLIITGSADNTARCWSFQAGTCLREYIGHYRAVTSMGTDNEGKFLYTGSVDHTIRAWNINSSTCLKVMEGHSGAILCLLVVNRLIYSGSQDGTAKCWVREFGDETRTYKGHKESVVCIKFVNGILFTGSGDTTVRAFDAKSGLTKRVYRGHENAITSLVVVGDSLYTGSSDGSLRVWDASRIGDEDNVEVEAQPDSDEEYKLEVERQELHKRRLDGCLDDDDIDLSSQAV